LTQIIEDQHSFSDDNPSSLSLHVAKKIADAALSKIEPMELENILNEQESTLVDIDQTQLDEIIFFADSNIQSVIDIIQG